MKRNVEDSKLEYGRGEYFEGKERAEEREKRGGRRRKCERSRELKGERGKRGEGRARVGVGEAGSSRKKETQPTR